MIVRHVGTVKHLRLSLALALVTVLVFGMTSFASLAFATSREEAPIDDSGRPTVRLLRGHTDALTVVPNGPTVSLVAREDVTDPGYKTFHNPDRIIFEVGADSYTEETKNISEVGKAGYALPQVEDSNLIWPGFETTTIASLNPKQTRFVLDKAAGPGEVYLWGTGEFGKTKSLLGGKFQLTPGATLTHTQPVHQHVNWLFTDPGIYKLTFHAEVDTADGTLVTDPATYTFDVKDRKSTDGSGKNESDPSPSADADGSPLDKGRINNGSGAGSQGGAAGGAQNNGGGAEEEVCIPTPVTKTVAGSGNSGKVSTIVGGTHTVAANTHVHPNWVFTAPGTYKVSITQSARMKSGTTASATGVLTFVVGGAGNANSGHFDVGTTATASGIAMSIKDDRQQPATWRDPSSLTFGLGDAARLKAPQGIEFIANAGQEIWMVSSSQVSGVPWVGANTMHPDLLRHTTGAVTWRLNSVSGPGAMAVFESGNFGKLVGKMWFGGATKGGSTGTTETVEYVGKTPSGEDCVLDEETVARLRAEGHTVAANSLPYTGTQVASLAVTAVLLMAMGVPLYIRRRVS